MRKMNIGIFFVIAILALVSVVSADLPSSVTGYLTWNSAQASSPDYFHVDVTAGGNPDLPTEPGYRGWCVDEPTPIWVPASYPFQVFSSINNPGPFGVVSANWSAINYILNHQGSARWPAVQAAIWHYSTSSAGVGYIPDNWFNPTGEPYNGVQYYDGIQTDYNALIADSEAHGKDFVPTCGRYAVVLYAPSYQVIIIEKELPACPPPVNAPEFPTLALPAAMVIGLVGVVYVIKGREN